MKKNRFITIILLAVLLLSVSCVSTCTKKTQATATDEDSLTFKTEKVKLDDSTAYAYITLGIELPVATNEVTTAIRQKLVELLGKSLPLVTSYENEPLFKAYSGDTDDTKSLADYYFGELKTLLGNLSQSDADERSQYINEDSTMTDDERQKRLAEIPRWGYDYELSLLVDTTNYVVFQSQDYIYMGGAHGGIGGDGMLTFDKATGEFIEQFIDTTAVAALQPLLIEGLLRYYSDCQVAMTKSRLLEHLMIEGDQIPLPVRAPYPAKDGLVFTYMQYEIASYADGMPSFVIPFADIAPYMTPQAKRLCGLSPSLP